MDLHYQKEATVGGLVLVGIALFVFGTMWLKGATFRPTGQVVQAEFPDVGALKVDNVVTISGVGVGKVSAVTLERPGRVLVTLALPSALELKADASASISSGFFSSDSRLLLDPGDSAEPFPAGGIIKGRMDGGVFEKGAALADRADSVLIGVQAIANQRTADELTRTLQSLQQVLTTMNRQLPSVTGETERTMASMRRLAERLDSTIAAVPIGNAIERADTLARNLSTMSIQLTATGARLDSVLQKINQGEGTMGKFATDSSFYVESRDAIRAMQRLLDELAKNPGKLTVQVKLF